MLGPTKLTVVVDYPDEAVIASSGYDMVVAALAASYPAWTDENGTNIEQLAAIAVAALTANAAPVNRKADKVLHEDS